MKALELADYCESLAREIDHSHFTHDLIAAAAELRRLAAVEAERDELKAELEDAKQAAKTWENEAERRSDRYIKCAAELERIKAMEPVAVRYDFDGHGWQYIDNGSGSDWLTRHKDGEALYALGSKT
jgi:hypothetical protein